ncbi:MAG: dTDP-4-dehydrorhamnose reductase [Candidatus Acidiferrales bacterium]
MKPKILLTGKNGQLGSELARLLPRLGELIALSRQQLDLTNAAEIRRTIREHRPQIIVNAAAYTAVDQAEKEEPLARSINTDAPAVMAEEAKKIGAMIVHYSTDYVFDGLKNTPYEEDDAPNPLNVYGKTKLAGEQAIVSTGVPHLIFRTEWVYATSGRNFLLTILRLATQREELRIVRDQIGSPTWSRAIAAATLKVLANLLEKVADDPAAAFSAISGTYHLTAAGKTSWYEFAKAILEEAARAPKDAPWFEAATSGKQLVTQRVIPITTVEFPTPARRPAYSVLSNHKFRNATNFQLQDWRTQLQMAFRETPPEEVLQSLTISKP